jgi:hypothetical protein
VIGQSIGNFRIVSRLGSGGMGEVFLAEQDAIDTKVAIKVLKAEISRDTQQVQRFFNEARAVGKIKHAGTVKIFEGGFHSSGHAYLVMELLEGETLSARIERVGRMPVAHACELGRQVASILAATHAQGITHRDLKPDNIFIVADAELASGERVKVLDFGIAKLTGTLASGPATVGTMGTPTYMSPEQWGNSGDVDWRTDAYALGCVLFEMVCGRPPFTGTTFADLCASHLAATPPSVRSLAPDVPAAFDELVARLLAKKPADRGTSMASIGGELEAIARNAPASVSSVAATMLPASKQPALIVPTQLAAEAPRPLTTLGATVGQLEDAPAPPRRGRGLALAAAGVVIAGGAATIVLMARARHQRPPEPTPVSEPSPVAAPVATETHRATPQAAPTVNADPAETPSLQTLKTLGSLDEALSLNPFVSIHGVTLQRHQVTFEEIAAFLESQPDGPQPLVWDRKTAKKTPAVWMTWDAARAYCAAHGGDLPTTEQWERAADGKWGIDDGTGKLGPLQEWTSTVENGLAVVRGGHAWMAKDQLADAAKTPMLKATAASAGAHPPNAVVAGDKIGFRCTK